MVALLQWATPLLHLEPDSDSKIDIVHGDLNPDNILIFKDEHGRVIPKIADFGFSCIGSENGSLVYLPLKTPWEAPDWHAAAFEIPDAKKLEVYSLGLIFLWVVFHDTESQLGLGSDTALEERFFVDFFAEKRDGNYQQRIRDLKLKDAPLRLAALLLKPIRNERFRQGLHNFFNSTLSLDPHKRALDIGGLKDSSEYTRYETCSIF